MAVSRSLPYPVVLLLVVVSGVVGWRCTPEPEPEPDLLWYSTCGDPVCSEYAGPFDGVPLCDTEVVGDACDDLGAECDPVDDCNALLRCTDEDPTTQPGGCPISLASAKKQIRYLDEPARDALLGRALAVKLATWRYRWEDDGTTEHLGFVIDDMPAGSPAVARDGRHVDTYGYTSLALAAVQAQQARIEALEARLAALEGR